MDFSTRASILAFLLLALSAYGAYETPLYFVLHRSIPANCLKCMCEVATGCNRTIGCQGLYCGPYRLSKQFWIESEKPTVNKEPFNAVGAYERCANDFECAERAVQAYMKRFKYSCAGQFDEIACDDHIRIHLYGGIGGCQRQLDPNAQYNYEECKKKHNNIGFDSFIKPGQHAFTARP